MLMIFATTEFNGILISVSSNDNNNYKREIKIMKKFRVKPTSGQQDRKGLM